MNGAGGDRPADRPKAPESDRRARARRCRPRSPPSAWSTTRPQSAGGPSTTRPRRGGRGTIYRIRPDGLWDPLWETGDDAPYDLLIEPGGSLLVGTGTDGKIFRITGDPARATLVARAAARQVTALLRESSGRIVGATSNPGKLVALGAESPSAARTSPTFATPARRRAGVSFAGARPGSLARSRSPRAAATPPRPTRRGARGRRSTRIRKASRSRARTRATCSGVRSSRATGPVRRR